MNRFPAGSLVLAILLLGAVSPLGAQAQGHEPPAPQESGAQPGAQPGAQSGATEQGPNRPDQEVPPAGTEVVAPPVQPVPSNKGKAIPEGCWFHPIHLDFGKTVENSRDSTEERAYEFENPTDKEQKILNVVPSCKCQQLRLLVAGKETALERNNEQDLAKPIVIPPHGKGKLLLKMNVVGPGGPRTGDIRVDTTDPGMSSFVLTGEAMVSAAFEVLPENIDLGVMRPQQTKRWSCTVRSLLSKEWKITKVDPVLPQGVKVTGYAPHVDENGQLSYLIQGTIGPGLDGSSVGGSILFHTDDPTHSFQVQLSVQVKTRAAFAPEFFTFSGYARKLARSKELYVWPTRADDSIEIERVVIDSTTVPKELVSIQVVPPAPAAGAAKMIQEKGMSEAVASNKLWRVVVKVKEGVPGPVLRVKGTIYLKGEGVVPKRFTITGFPRG